jgi:hypothetical protein
MSLTSVDCHILMLVSVCHCSQFVMLQDAQGLGCLPEIQDYLGACDATHPGSGHHSQQIFQSICDVSVSDFL